MRYALHIAKTYDVIIVIRSSLSCDITRIWILWCYGWVEIRERSQRLSEEGERSSGSAMSASERGYAHKCKVTKVSE